MEGQVVEHVYRWGFTWGAASFEGLPYAVHVLKIAVLQGSRTRIAPTLSFVGDEHEEREQNLKLSAPPPSWRYKCSSLYVPVNGAG